MIQIPLNKGPRLGCPWTHVEVKYRPSSTCQHRLGYQWLNGSLSAPHVWAELGIWVACWKQNNICHPSRRGRPVTHLLWELHPFCQRGSVFCFLLLWEHHFRPLLSGCRGNFGYCHSDPNSQHLPLWHTIFVLVFLVETEERWSGYEVSGLAAYAWSCAAVPITALLF